MKRKVSWKLWLSACFSLSLVAASIALFWKIASNPYAKLQILPLSQWGISTTIWDYGDKSVSEEKYLFFKVEQTTYFLPYLSSGVSGQLPSKVMPGASPVTEQATEIENVRRRTFSPIKAK